MDSVGPGASTFPELLPTSKDRAAREREWRALHTEAIWGVVKTGLRA